MHHACADGITMMRWTANNLGETADDMELEPIWCTPRTSRRHRDNTGLLSLKMLTALWNNIGGIRKQAMVLRAWRQ